MNYILIIFQYYLMTDFLKVKVMNWLEGNHLQLMIIFKFTSFILIHPCRNVYYKG